MGRVDRVLGWRLGYSRSQVGGDTRVSGLLER